MTSYGWRSRSRAGSEVEPYTAAKNTVTCLRSSSRAAREERIFSGVVCEAFPEVDTKWCIRPDAGAEDLRSEVRPRQRADITLNTDWDWVIDGSFCSHSCKGG